ncbi:MAG TPA: PilZ domain-containing protein [Kiritimatiellia bacterium]|nr:PilZ domain-containing protein [Kiritimatiellia bacterium]HRZ11665.1 PilZ domain-containing protein [Kiritimatiellia bacterium]HSA16784.1 PilZ domain-containing protein [Kiritimatiellia bacterium]
MIESIAGRERRRHRRLACERPASIHVVHCPDDPRLERRSLYGMVRNISAGGLKFTCPQSLPPGTLVHLDVAMPERGCLFKLAARTVRSTPRTDRFEVGAALEDSFFRRRDPWARMVFDALRELNDPV